MVGAGMRKFGRRTTRSSFINLEERVDEGGDEEEEEEEEQHTDTIHFEPDVYGASIVVLVRDLYRLSRSNEHRWLRIGRITVTLFLMFANVATQIFLLIEVKYFVSAKAVHDIRNVYDVYEAAMYPNHTYTTVNGKQRGKRGYFDAEMFSTLSDEEKESVCNIPFSNPKFSLVVLFIWSMTCLGEIRATLAQTKNLIINLENADSMRDIKDRKETEDFVIARLPRHLKAVLALFIFLPRFMISMVLLWLGCRWLVATNDFTDLLLNGVALEFIISLKSLLYMVLIPGRTQRQTETTSIMRTSVDLPTVGTFVGAFSWGFIGCGWVVMYFLYFQRVLPDYNFDVHAVCQTWVQERYTV